AQPAQFSKSSSVPYADRSCTPTGRPL
ncbi:hypothetical protein ATR1_274c0001, partial [Acetobacter tropicalis]